MKRIYILLCVIFLFHENKAQHTLTASFNPAVGDIESYINLDSIGLFLGSSGISQTWNYSGISTGTNASYGYTYVPMTSVINNTLYPNGTIARRIGVGGYDIVYNNTPSKVEYLGAAQPTASNCQVYGDPAIFYPFPFTFGSSSSDTYSCTSWSGTITGTITTTGDGTGTLQLPSGNYSNILKLTFFFYEPGGFTTIQNSYYSALSKFPLLTISSTTVGATIYMSGQINTLVSTSVKESLQEKAFTVFPNPISNGVLFVKSESGKPLTGIEINNALGQEIFTLQPREINGTKKIDVSGMSKGIYYLKLSTQETVKTQKIIIE